MAIASTDASWEALDVEEGVPIQCDGALFNEEHVKVYYGASNALAILNTDYTVTMASDHYAFTVTPTASLITKIDNSGESNVVYVARETPRVTTATAALSGRANFLFREFERIVMRFQELYDTVMNRTFRSAYGTEPPTLVGPFVEGDMLIVGPDNTLIPIQLSDAIGVSGDEVMNLTYTPDDVVGAAPTLIKHSMSEDLNLWMFKSEGTYIELGEDGDPDHNSDILDQALYACGYDSNKIRGLQLPTGLLNINNGQHGIPNGVWLKGYGAVERLDRIGTAVQGVGLGDTFRIEGDIDVASGQHYFGGKITDIKFLGDDTQPDGIGEAVGDAISFMTLGGDDVAPQDNCVIQANIFRHPPRHGIYLPRGGLPITWGNNKFRECGGAGLYMDAGFNVQSAHFLDFSGDRNVSGVIYLKNMVDTGNILITNLKSEMQKNTHYGNVNAQLIAVYIQDCDEGTTIGISGATHISAVIEGGFRRRTGDLVNIEGSNIPDMRWDDMHIRLNFGGQTDDPGDPVAYYVRTPWSTYGTKYGRINASETYVRKIHDDQGFETFGEEEVYHNRSVENVGSQIAGVTPGRSLYETDAGTDLKSWLQTASGGSLQDRAVSDAGVATTYRSVNRTLGVAKNILDAIPYRPGLYTIATLPVAASVPNCVAMISDGVSGKGRLVMSSDIITPATWVWRYVSDDTAV